MELVKNLGLKAEASPAEGEAAPQCSSTTLRKRLPHRGSSVRTILLFEAVFLFIFSAFLLLLELAFYKRLVSGEARLNPAHRMH